MDEKYLQDIYNWITNKDASYKSDFSFDAFKTKMQDPAYSKKMHDWMGTVEPEQSKKKRLIEIQKPSTELPSEDGSLASQETKSKFTFDPNEFKQQRAVADATFIPKPIDRVEVQKKRAETVTLLNAQKIKDAQKKKEEESRIKANSLGIIKTPEFQQKLKIVDDKLIDKEEEEVVPKMNTEFGKYGFTFEESGVGDAMIVRSFDGKHTLKVDLDPFTNATEVAESGKLREFLNAYAQENFKIENEDFLSKASKAQNLRTAGRINPDGTESTVKMTSFEQDGKFFAIPTLFPKDPKSYNTSASTWQELPFEQALKTARERGEIFQFNTDQEAKDFANGSWKDVSTRDIEADKWYKERGLDYITEKKRWDKYKELDDIIDFVEGNNEEARASLKKSNPELFIKGRIREDAKQYTEELKKQRDALEPLVKDYGFLSDGKSEVARMDWDVQLAKKEKQIAGEAIKINNDAKAMEYELDQQSIEKFGVPAKDLLKYKNIDPNTQVEFDKLQKEYYVVQQTQKEAATKFEIAKTYFDGKADKQVNGEFKENLRGFWNATTDAYNQGQIGQQLLSFTMPGGKDVSSFEDRKEAAEYIAKQYADMSNTEDRAMARWRNARGFQESFGVFFDDPAEMLATMVSSSLSQILPYGTKIVAASVAAGAGIGAAAGAPAGGVGAVPGAIAGAGYGLRTGMALTNLAAEYTNAVMAAVESKGYNPMDPESLAEALGNQEVWDEGKATGLTRGIPIAVVDFLTAGLAGRVFKPTSVLASKGSKVAFGAAERIVLDPLAEGAGELAAQSAEIALGTGRKKIGWKEIAEESMGGLGSNTVNWGINSYKDIRNKNNVDIANTLTQIGSISSERASDEKITSWANNMLQLKKIDEDVAQRINENVGLRREARELLEVGTEKKTNSESLNRTMELLAARNELSSTQNRREIYRSKIQAINEELAVIGETKKLLPIDKSVDLSSIIGTTRQGTSQYSIDGRRFTKEQFIEKVNALPDEQLNRVVLGINNDPETGKLIKLRYDAIQKQTTGQVPVLTETGVSQEVPQGVPQTGLEVAPAGTEEVAPEGGTQEVKVIDRDSKEEFTALLQPIRDIFDNVKESNFSSLKGVTFNQLVNNWNEYKNIDNEDIRTIKYFVENPSNTAIVLDKNGVVSDGNHRLIADLINNKESIYAVSQKDNPTALGDLYLEIQQPIIEVVSLKTQIDEQKTPTTITATTTDVQTEVTPENIVGFNEGIQSVADAAAEYKRTFLPENRQKERPAGPVRKLLTNVSKAISNVYDKIVHNPEDPKVKEAYEAMMDDTKDQYKFILSKGLNVEKHTGTGEPYANSKEMLADIRDNNTLKFLPNDVAFGQGDSYPKNSIGLQPSGVKLKDGYEMTNSELFRVVHDYFGHGILGNQFGAIGEENATLQHLDLFSDKAAPAVIFQTRGQNSWVNFSGKNDRANELRKQARELIKQGKTEEANKLFEKANKIFKFAEPKDNIFPNEFNFKKYDTARRLENKEAINNRTEKGNNELSSALETNSNRSRRTRGVDKRDVRRTERLRGNDVNVIAEYTFDNEVNNGIKEAFPLFQGVQKVYEITNGDVYRKLIIEGLQGNKFAASVTVHTPEEFNGMRMFVTEDGSTGITLTKEGFLGGAFSSSEKPNNLAQLMVLGIKEGATTAECFDTVLPDYYANFGFKAVSRTAFNDEFKPMIANGNTVKDWDYETYKKFNNGRPDVVFLIYDGGDRNTIEERLGQFDLYKTYEKENTQAFDKDGYDSAEAIMKQMAIKTIEHYEEQEGTKTIQKATDVTPEEQAAPEADINELMTADTKDPAVLEKIFNALDGIDKSIDKFLKSGPNSVTTVIPLGAMKIIVKALKALVKGGMMLQDAIKKVAADNNVKEADIISSLTIINSTEANVPEGLSEGDLPGFDRMMEQVDGIVQKSKDKGVDEAKIKDNVMQYVMKSKVYETASDIQREKLVREVNKMFGVKEKSAPSVGKLFGNIKDVTKITMTEKTALVKQIKDLARGARDAKTAISKASTIVTTAIKELASSGTITAKQAANVLRRFDKTNLLSQESIDRFTQYMTKVFENAEYADNLKTAKAAKTEISSLSKNENKNANLRDLASEFIKIDPSLVKDIDAYNKMASEIKESLKGSNIIGKKVNFAEIVNIEKATEYIKETMDAQKETLQKFAADEIQELMGVDPADFTYEEMLSLLQKDEPITKYNESIIRNLISKMFGINSSIIKSMIQTGEDAFTGDPVSFTKAQVDVINRFMDMSLDRLNAKEALQAVDALGNFIQNKSTAKMESVLADYQGKLNGEAIVKKGIFAVPLKKLFSTGFGRLLAEQTTNLGPLFTRLFKGVQRGGLVEEYMGVTKLINSKAFAETQANNIANDYVKEFYGRKANGEKFNTERNNVERGMASFMLRNIIGTETEMQEEFDRRKKLIAESIDVLREGNEPEQKKSNLYSEVFDKIVSESTNIQDVKDKTDAVNLEAVDFWIEQWASKYDEMADVSLNVYNKVLDKDINYNPDKFFKLSRETGEVELTNNESAFHNNNGTIYKKESSGLMTAVKPKSLPKNTKNGQVSRYIDLAFDKNNANSMYDALVDIKTAAAIRQVESFLNSAAFNKIVSTPLDAKILKDRIQLYVSNIRNKNPYSGVDELSKTIRRLNKIAAIGVGQALGGITQPLKQVIPVAINTLINAGGLDLGAVFNSSKNNFISNSGYPIANRGVESQAQIESINKLIEQAAKSKGEQALKFIEKANKKWLNIFLVKPDVFIARASWLSYYEQSLKKQGISAKGIDYSSHTLNEQAANYAQRMVDRQQNVSDADQSGKLFADKNEIKQVVVKMLMPFASFRMNQATRLANDLSTIGYWSVSTTEDKVIAARSLAGFAVEMAAFKVIGGGIAVLLGTATKMMMGKEEDDEEQQKRIDNIIKGQLTGTVTDIFSPFPLFDKPIQGLTYYSLDKIQNMLETPKDSKFNIYDVKKEEFIRSLGLFGITLDRAKQLGDLVYLSQTGKFENDYGKDKWISEQDQSALAKLIGPAVLINLGLVPSEVSSVIRMAISNAKKDASTKEGGKTEEDIEMDDNKESESEANKSEKEENRSEKIEVLEKLQKRTFNNKMKEEIEKQINVLSMSEEDKKEYDKENKGLKELKKSEHKALLQEYDNETDMKRYNRRLWEKTFGPNSSYYKENKVENEVEKMLRKELRLKEDKEYNYRAPMKKKW